LYKRCDLSYFVDPSPACTCVSSATAHTDAADADFLADTDHAQSFLQNPYYFMFASPAKPDDDAELHWLKVRSLIPPLPPPPIQSLTMSPLYRTVVRTVPPALSFSPSTTSRTPNPTTKTWAYSSFLTLASAQRAVIVSS